MKITEIEVDGKRYELSISKEVECCQYCTFSDKKECPGHCTSKVNEDYFDGFWIEKK